MSPGKPVRREKLERKKPKASLNKFQLGLLGVLLVIAGDHVLLSYKMIYGKASDSRELSPQCWLSNHNLDTTDVTLETISKEMECSSRLTPKEKETLQSTIKSLQVLDQDNAVPAADLKLNAIENKSPYCYIFLIGDIHEGRPDYKGFLYDVLVSTYLLQQLGSTADVVLFTQMASDAKSNQLPDNELKALNDLNIQVQALPKPATPEDAAAGMEFGKFHGLKLTKHKRVLFLMADAMPLANLDYLFHLSDPDHTDTPTLLQPNVLLASRGEPCSSAMFMLQPEEGDWDKVHAMIENHLTLAKAGKGRDWAGGWGYNFKAENDQWRATVQSGDLWRFHGGLSDQGLLYYWTKFVKRQVSIIIQDEIENWIPSSDASFTTVDGKPKPVLENTLQHEAISKYSRDHPLAYQFECDTEKVQAKEKKHQPQQCLVPYRDYVHMFGDHRPWLAESPERKMARKNSKEFNAAHSLWFTTLKELNAMFSLGLDFEQSLVEMKVERRRK